MGGRSHRLLVLLAVLTLSAPPQVSFGVGDPAAVALARLQRDLAALTAAQAARLVVIDDLDAAPAAFGQAVAELTGSLARVPVLVLVNHRLAAPPSLLRLVERIAPLEQRLELGPLEPESVRAIAALDNGASEKDRPFYEGKVAAASFFAPNRRGWMLGALVVSALTTGAMAANRSAASQPRRYAIIPPLPKPVA